MARKTRRPAAPILPPPGSYFHRSQLPLQALIFLLPLIVLYEFGAFAYATHYADVATQYGVIHTIQTIHIKARLWLMSFFEWFGVGGFFLPGLVMVGAMLGWHVMRGDAWEVEPRLYVGMALESVLLALPLFVFGLVLSPVPHPGYSLAALARLSGADGLTAGGLPWQAEFVFSIGAGIYEELLFRLILIAAVHALLVDWLALPDVWGSVAAMAVSAVAFALYHFSRGNPFAWDLFGYYTVAGAYLACVYVWRGIGVAAGTHAFYDILVVLWHLV